ncbi:fluoride efflux transporter CrcB [Segniliparus rugosus]|uniref:Fluoride-specific ion channel FluC n=1 Tax=Segniliparus rugosus (strain ATCC BAA-974 / DSM 45345 / CCUG 50838 / CIP 108380 / JCM 13579 / CDC 945) TaxID=679197 RepID=E5XKP1_SEGRC|nr:fluoride efflux transporter CrcB [Segniliparus rugosus]EFV15088.1 crcB protein [Segniliparus rugosus ATCC BAA-974]
MIELFLVGLGGGIGSAARYALGQLWPSVPGGFPAATFVINTSGCFCIGVLLSAILERWPKAARPRLFFGTGFLGGYTTFSTYTVETARLAQTGHALQAVGYGLATVVCALAATATGVWIARRVLRMAGGGSR